MECKSALLTLENESITLPALANPFNPHAFFKTRSGLWVSDQFVRRVLLQATVVDKLDDAPCSSYNLKKNLYDREITPELPKGYEWGASEVCARIAQMIKRQPNGGKGDLLNNGDANIFYVPGYAVGVDWCADDRQWRVSAWRLDSSDWKADRRVFARN